MKLQEIDWSRSRAAKKHLSVSGATLHRWMRSGKIETRKVGGVRYFNVGKFLRQLDQQEDVSE